MHAGTQCAVRRVCLNLSAPRQHLDDAQQLENMLSYDEQVSATSAPAAALLDRCRSARPLPPLLMCVRLQIAMARGLSVRQLQVTAPRRATVR